MRTIKAHYNHLNPWYLRLDIELTTTKPLFYDERITKTTTKLVLILIIELTTLIKNHQEQSILDWTGLDCTSISSPS